MGWSSKGRSGDAARLLALVLGLVANAGYAQDDNGGFVVRDTNVGYIDPALPANRLRLRADLAYEIDSGSRAEFIYARSGPLGPGFPQPERQLDLQEFALMAESRFSANGSISLELPFRLVNPEFNDNSGGLGDLNVAVKYVLNESACCGRVVAGQLRVYAPTGDADRGLGVDHASLEPSLLVYQPLSRGWILEGELRDWIALGGTDQGNVLRYGVGVSRPLTSACGDWYAAPVAELVGWTVLEGQAVVVPAQNQAIVVDATGDTIVNAKLGMRIGRRLGWDTYVGYGRAVTGDAWYRDTIRAELRRTF